MRLFRSFPLSLEFTLILLLRLHLTPARTVTNSRAESSPTSTGEASASSSTSSSHLPEAGLDLSADRREAPEEPRSGQNQFGEEDKDGADAEKDPRLG